MESLEQKYNVSRETVDRLKTYEVSLKEWQSKFNLVSNASLENAWERHFLDSMQLYSLIPSDARTLYDFGSGAGFPGMVLAIMAKGRTPYLNVSLIESIKKKTLYLNEVKRITGTDVNIINDRIENIKAESVDVVTSRAMASLSKLLEYTSRFFSKKTKCIFPKGKSYQEEISEAKKLWKFDVEIVQSSQSDEGVILVISNISKKGAR